MKNKISKALSKPKTIIPIFAIITIIVVSILYSHVGKAPVVSIDMSTTSSNISDSLNIVNLSFPKSGRIESVSVKEGQEVHKGDILAKLSAPDQEGAIRQAKSALDLAEAEYSGMNLQYKNTKNQQDLIVKNAYQTLLSSGLEGVPSKQDLNIPIISGSYSCNKEGYYKIIPYSSSDNDTGYSFKYSGLEEGIASVKYDNPVALGNCGLQIKFNKIIDFDPNITWTIDIPNTKSSVYITNKNAYTLAVETREKVLSELSENIGNEGSGMSVEIAKVNAAKGAYDAALGAYQNNIITAPIDGVISFIDKDLKVGQSVIANKNIISIEIK